METKSLAMQTPSADDEIQAELDARKDRAFAAVRGVQRAHRTLKSASEVRISAEKELLSAQQAEKLASERLAAAVTRLDDI